MPTSGSCLPLASLRPETDTVGVELDAELLSIAQARARHCGLPEWNLMQSPSGTEIPPGLGQFDCIVMEAVYEHILPAERQCVLTLLWRHLAPGGSLIMSGTPYRYSPVETHTTGLPL